MVARVIWPVTPVRWVHQRRGASAKVQHVVAHRTDEVDESRQFTRLLCGSQLFSGRYWFSEQRGPKTQAPLVTLAPRRDIPLCPLCERRLPIALREMAR